MTQASEHHVFHLSIAVADLAAAKRFYVDVLGATIGREHDDWLDVLLWGHQITLQLQPDEVVPPDRQGKRHFGVSLPWPEWVAAADRVRSCGAAFLSEPVVKFAGMPEEQGKFYLADPSHNVIEIKAYRSLTTLGY